MYPSTATLKDGRVVDLTYIEIAEARGLQPPWICHSVEAHLNGMNIGYVRVTYVPRALFETCFPTVWHFWMKQKGWCGNPDDPVQVWKDAHHRLSTRSPSHPEVSSWSLTKDQYPGDAVAREELARLERNNPKLQRAMDDFAAFQVDRPYIDYIRVADPDEPGFKGAADFKRLGLGTALYEAMARWLAVEKGMALHSSGLQSESAKATWAAMVVRGTLPITEVPRPADPDKRTCYRMDFRGFTSPDPA